MGEGRDHLGEDVDAETLDYVNADIDLVYEASGRTLSAEFVGPVRAKNSFWVALVIGAIALVGVVVAPAGQTILLAAMAWFVVALLVGSSGINGENPWRGRVTRKRLDVMGDYVQLPNLDGVNRRDFNLQNIRRVALKESEEGRFLVVTTEQNAFEIPCGGNTPDSVEAFAEVFTSLLRKSPFNPLSLGVELTPGGPRNAAGDGVSHRPEPDNGGEAEVDDRRHCENGAQHGRKRG